MSVLHSRVLGRSATAAGMAAPRSSDNSLQRAIAVERAPDRIRTCGLPLRRRSLYPTELPGQPASHATRHGAGPASQEREVVLVPHGRVRVVLPRGRKGAEDRAVVPGSVDLGRPDPAPGALCSSRIGEQRASASSCSDRRRDLHAHGPLDGLQGVVNAEDGERARALRVRVGGTAHSSSGVQSHTSTKKAEASRNHEMLQVQPSSVSISNSRSVTMPP